ncbi:hypothetical protein PC129_g23094 [Phytophthora cactorum]|uniref:Uncharacterized protein n=1 Tax=Phytophthora cactorum TaxID=29920 RepID=A0A329T318_9STRA|nr:hypothetical protein Pcac1_g3863 [Phytophthora cactorum]KAG2795183.1 hypothetical protein PC111_g22259 [Phytophthora cactorum]KAG2804306.1 hypothetical protein PC112_g18778 [Phytophthora cactorum]KAG2852118.1 hypothetical protein PC113_g15295 [Phytophthora cactorum]KAG2880825.1 hypothetical protein PC115_g22407 [Phytophthora cactorum]
MPKKPIKRLHFTWSEKTEVIEKAKLSPCMSYTKTSK